MHRVKLVDVKGGSTAFNSRAAPFLLASIGLVLHRGGVEVRSEKLVGTGMGRMVSREGSKAERFGEKIYRYYVSS